MFDKNKFAQILKNINETYNSQRDFSKKSEINRTYLSQYMNMKLDEPPKPKILEKLANNSNGVTTYNELMQVCGYIYITELTPTSYGIGSKYWKMIYGDVEKIVLSQKGSTFFASFFDSLLKKAKKSNDDFLEINFSTDLVVPKTCNLEDFAEYNRIASFIICSLINNNTLSITDSEKEELLDIVQEQLNIASSITQNTTSSNDLIKKIGCIPLSDIKSSQVPLLRHCKSWI